MISDWCLATFSPLKAGVWPFLKSLAWVASLSAITFEMDFKTVVDDVYPMNPDPSKYGSIVTKCRFICNLNNDYKVVFMKQSAIGTPHILARASITFTSQSSFRNVPSSILNLLRSRLAPT